MKFCFQFLDQMKITNFNIKNSCDRWLIFIYDPKDAQSAHEAFAGSSEYCYFDVVMYEGVDEDQERPRQAAICVLERTPRPPDNEVEMPE